MHHLPCFFLATALAVLVGGCMWGRLQINDPTVADRARLIKPGVTTATQVSDIIGAQPTVRIPGEKRLVLGYTYGDTKSHGLMLIAFNFMRSTTVTDTLYIETDAKTGLVTDVFLPKQHDIEWRFWPFDD